MNSLSPEIFTLVFSHLDPAEKKAPFATVSRKWQPVIERHTFNSLSLNSAEFLELKTIMSSDHRRSSLACLQWKIMLPPFMEDGTSNRAVETRATSLSRDETFSKSIREVLTEIKLWETECPSLKSGRQLIIRFSARLIGGEDSLLKTQIERNPLRLLGREELPSLERPISFYTTFMTPWRVDGASMAKIASAFEHLERLDLDLYDNEKRNALIRQQNRYDMSKQLDNVSTKDLNSVWLHMIQSATRDESFEIPSALLPSEPDVDYLSKSIYRISLAPNLVRISIRGFSVISESLFWPTTPSETDVVWPNLERIEVEFDMKAADGGWYFSPGRLPGQEGQDGSADDEEESELGEDEMSDGQLELHRRNEAAAREIGEFPVNSCRNIPNEGKIYPLFRAVSKAATKMPKLTKLWVRTKFTYPTRTFCEMWFVSPGVRCPRDIKAARKGHLVDDVRKTWRLYWNVVGCEADEECLRIWKEGEAAKGRECSIHVLS